MENIEHLLRQSLEQYSDILTQVHSLPKILKNTMPGDIEDFCARLQDKQKEARKTDETLNALIRDKGVDLSSNPYFKERHDLMRRIAEHNDLLFPKITGMMSVISAEISRIKDGRTAMSGYKPNIEGSGSIINRTR